MIAVASALFFRRQQFLSRALLTLAAITKTKELTKLTLRKKPIRELSTK